jgi:hypothetical protein
MLCVVIYSECNYCTVYPETCCTSKNDVGADLVTKEPTISCLLCCHKKNCMNNMHYLIENYTTAVVGMCGTFWYEFMVLGGGEGGGQIVFVHIYFTCGIC